MYFYLFRLSDVNLNMQLVYQKSSEEAYAELITNNSKSFLIDVRSRQEWADTGIPQISLDREKVILCEWRIKPTMEFNENFFYELKLHSILLDLSIKLISLISYSRIILVVKYILKYPPHPLKL